MSSSLPLDCAKLKRQDKHQSLSTAAIPETPGLLRSKAPRSFVDILRSIGDDASRAVSKLRKASDLEKPRLELWSSHFVTGALVTRAASKVKIFDDRIEYTLNDHPLEGKVLMVMYFKHFVQWKFQGNIFSFRLAKEMKYFPRFYDALNDDHRLKIRLDDPTKVEQVLTPLIAKVAEVGNN